MSISASDLVLLKTHACKLCAEGDNYMPRIILGPGMEVEVSPYWTILMIGPPGMIKKRINFDS